MNWFRNWFYLYIRPTAAERAFEKSICLLREPYRVQYPFPGLRRVVDFALPESKVVIEVDGASHLAVEQRRKDITSSIALEKLGWSVIRFTNEEALAGVEPRSIFDRVAIRPTLGELEEALRQLPELPVKPAKPRARSPKPGPKSARKRQKRA